MSVIFWDFDGTLVLSNSLWSRSVLKALQEADEHTHVVLSDIRPHMRRGFTWQTPENDYTQLIGEAWWTPMLEHIYHSYVACGVPSTTASKAIASFRDIIKRTENYELYPDTITVLTRTKERGYRNVLLSNNYPELEEVLPSLGLDTLLDGVIISALKGYDKPRKELFDIAKKRFPSDHYYMVGDNPSADVLGGQRSGMTTVLVHSDDDHSRPHYHFEALTDILTIL